MFIITPIKDALDKKTGLPDYSTILVSSITDGYVSTVNGWLIGYIVSSQANAIRINLKDVAWSGASTSSPQISVPISVGDTINFYSQPTTNMLRIYGVR